MSLSVSRMVFLLQRGHMTFLFKQILVWFLMKSSYFMSSFCFSLQPSRPHFTSFSFRKTILRIVVGLKPYIYLQLAQLLSLIISKHSLQNIPSAHPALHSMGL